MVGLVCSVVCLSAVLSAYLRRCALAARAILRLLRGGVCTIILSMSKAGGGKCGCGMWVTTPNTTVNVNIMPP